MLARNPISPFRLTSIQILANQAPYSQFKDEKIDPDITQSALPADMQVLYLPQRVKMFLEACWSFTPEHRPSIAACMQTLIDESSERTPQQSGIIQLDWEAILLHSLVS